MEVRNSIRTFFLEQGRNSRFLLENLGRFVPFASCFAESIELLPKRFGRSQPHPILLHPFELVITIRKAIRATIATSQAQRPQ